MSKSKRNATFANSRRQCICAVCDETLIYKNLAKHFHKFHKNPKEKIPKGTKPVETYFFSTHSSNETILDLDEGHLRSEQISEKSMPDNELVFEKVDENEIHKYPDSNEKIILKLNDIQKAIVDYENIREKNDDMIRTVNEKVNLILENVQKLRCSSSSLSSSSRSLTKNGTTKVYIEKDLDSACAAKSIDDIMDRLNNWKLHYPNDTAKANNNPDGLFCIFCSEEISTTITGVIRYDFAFGDNFKRANGLPREFRNLKTKIRAHMDSPFHMERILARLEMEKITQDKKFLDRNEKAGMACARNAYKAIYSNHSYLSYEVEIAKDVANNVNMGELNHSADFCSEMVDCFYTCLSTRFKEQILLPLEGTGRPSPVTIIFDKYTPMHRTLNIIALNTYICGSLQTVFLDCPVVQHHDAKGLAENVSSSITKLYTGDQWMQSYCGTSADKQMILLGYGTHLDGMVSANGSEFFSHIWDAGHLVELASKDATEENGWVSDITAKFYSPKSFSTTRWATYCHTTLTGFLSNYPYYYDHLQRNQNDFDLTDKINTLDFALKCAILVDVYSEIAILSRTLQCPDLHFWHIHRAVTITCDNLLRMSNALKNETLAISELQVLSSPHSEDCLFRWTGDALDEISKFFTYKSKPIRNKQHVPTVTRSSARKLEHQDHSQSERIRRCRQVACEFIDSLHESLQSRFSNNNSEVLQFASKAFDLHEIYCREAGNGEGVNAFMKYADAAIKVNFLGTFAADKLKEQYDAFEIFVRESKEEWYDNCNFSSKRKFEKKLYNKLLHNPSTFPEVNHLLASATVRHANESQCESIGSVVGRHYEHRGTLRAEKITKEAFIAWNGPLPFSQSNTLLRDALCLRFGGGPDKWHFLRVTKRTDLLQAYLFHSKVVDRLNTVSCRINYI
ncbi:hypothetical protein Bhyg_13085 [Pseudolycoriella hygida]|uniref:Uncharacterized protein n=1 Tax=Pseudolycoriella hygida TaxID=35572 RepID=A0A9Q0RZZ7_9DIPT|nr:hypothetical protein Bhyg_13085 [Pseudolycoriella hygida]